MKKYFFLATALVALASCSIDEMINDSSPNVNQSNGNPNAIVFNSGTGAITRGEKTGAEAADLLNKKFIVSGFKGAGDVTTGSTVFDNYIVNWTENTAGKTGSNTSDWEYVNITAAAPSSLAGKTQSIKYWDYNASQYDFIAYSTGTATGITATAISAANAKSAAYTLKGTDAELAKCYIADMVTIYKDGTDNKKYQDEVKLTFHALASKVRIALYETVPGYSVKDVKFYTNATTTLATGATETNATLFTTGTATTDNFYTEGTYKVYFPTIGKSKTSDNDYNVAHVSFTPETSGTAKNKSFSSLNYTDKESYEKSTGTIWLGRTASTASFAGTASPYYMPVMPNPTGTVLQLRIDYTLESVDGSGEEIKIHGATAYVPLIYSQWKPNYAYTYIFKISDNTNGWTSTVNTDPAGLYPITFDAVVIGTTNNNQSTISNVASPSITTYQKGHDVDALDDAKADEYKTSNGDIYIQVMNNGTLVNNLDTQGKLYTVTGGPTGAVATEADIMDALNIPANSTTDPITGRNGWILTDATNSASVSATITAIPDADGKDITVETKTAAKFTPVGSTIYAYVYDTQTYGGDYYPIAPADWNQTDNVYYTDAQCNTKANSAFAAGTYYKKSSIVTTAVTLSSEPGDFKTAYYIDEACTTLATTYADGIYYQKYTVNNKIYGVKVIKVQ